MDVMQAVYLVDPSNNQIIDLRLYFLYLFGAVIGTGAGIVFWIRFFRA